MCRCYLTAETSEQEAHLATALALGEILPGAQAPWDPCSDGFLFLGRRELVLCLLSHVIQHIPIEYPPCIMQEAGEWLIDRRAPCPLGSAVCLCMQHRLFPSLTTLCVSLFFVLSSIHLSPACSTSQRLASEEDAAGRMMLISGPESLMAGLYHPARRYFTINDHFMASPITGS